MPFVFAFIAFNILDLDGSNLISFTRSFEHSMIDADIATAPRIEPLPERFECFENKRRPTVDDAPNQARWHTSELRALSRLEKARTHLYHISLPRDAVPG